MSLKDTVKFSKSLQRRYRGLGLLHHTHLRVLALALTVGEVVVGYSLFRSHDWLGAYAMGAYLVKEHVITRFVE